MVRWVLVSVWVVHPASRSLMSHGLELPASPTAGNGDGQGETLAADGQGETLAADGLFNLCHTQMHVKGTETASASYRPYLFSEKKLRGNTSAPLKP